MRALATASTTPPPRAANDTPTRTPATSPASAPTLTHGRCTRQRSGRAATTSTRSALPSAGPSASAKSAPAQSRTTSISRRATADAAATTRPATASPAPPAPRPLPAARAAPARSADRYWATPRAARIPGTATVPTTAAVPPSIGRAGQHRPRNILRDTLARPWPRRNHPSAPARTAHPPSVRMPCRARPTAPTGAGNRPHTSAADPTPNSWSETVPSRATMGAASAPRPRVVRHVRLPCTATWTRYAATLPHGPATGRGATTPSGGSAAHAWRRGHASGAPHRSRPRCMRAPTTARCTAGSPPSPIGGTQGAALPPRPGRRASAHSAASPLRPAPRRTTTAHTARPRAAASPGWPGPAAPTTPPPLTHRRQPLALRGAAPGAAPLSNSSRAAGLAATAPAPAAARRTPLLPPPPRPPIRRSLKSYIPPPTASGRAGSPDGGAPLPPCPLPCGAARRRPMCTSGGVVRIRPGIHAYAQAVKSEGLYTAVGRPRPCQ